MNDHTTQAKEILICLGQHAKAQGLTRTEIAKRANTTQSYVSQLFQGKVGCTLSTFLTLAEACDITPQEAIALQPPKTITIAGHTYTLAEEA